MTVEDFLKGTALKQVTALPLNKEIKDIYASDWLGWALGHIHEKEVLLTIQCSMNVIALAIQKKLTAVIFCEGVTPTLEMVMKANEEKIILITSPVNEIKTAYLYFSRLT